MRHLKIVAAVAFIALSLCAFSAYAEDAGKNSSVVPPANEDQYAKGTVPVENSYACQVGYTPSCEMPVLLNKTTKKWNISGLPARKDG